MQSWTILLAAVDQGPIISNLITAGIVAVVTAVVTSYVTTRRLSDRIQGLSEAVKAQTETILHLQSALAEIRQERVQCELRAARTHATRDELAYIIGESAGNQREFFTEIKELAASVRDSIGKTHNRLDNALERITRLEASDKGTPHES